MIGYLLFEIVRIIPIKIPNIISYTYLTFHKKSFLGNYKTNLLKHALKKSKALIWPSMEMCTNAQNKFPKFAKKNHFTVNPMMEVRDLSLPVEKRLDDPFFRNGVYAAGKSDRDFNIVIRAFRNTNIPVTIVCTDKYAITEQNITSNIRILRFSEVDPNQYYALALQAFCIINSVSNAISPCGQLLVHFAMENSIPTISTNGYSVKDYIVNNENGLLFNVGKSEEILACYYQLKNDETFKNKITTNAKKTIKAMSANNFIEKLINIVED
jgi:glycosyltransferase involved in cell wall biosynthesis